MENSELQKLIDGIGAIAELWGITYKNFSDQGFEPVEALSHTRELMQIILMMNK